MGEEEILIGHPFLRVRGWLGVTVQNVTSAIAQKFGLAEIRGALVADVSADSPASRRGDVILAFGSTPVESSSQLSNLVGIVKVGTTMPVRIMRGKQELTIKVTITEMPKSLTTHGPGQTEGHFTNVLGNIRVENLNPQTARELGLSLDTRGVVIASVNQDSAAADTGLQRGDVILEIDTQGVRNVDDYNRIAGTIGNGDAVRSG